MSSADSSGRSIPKAEAVWIFDLDGTILSVNSFRFWVLAMLVGRFGGLSYAGRIVLSLRTARLLAARKFFGKSHASFKRHLQALWADTLVKDAEQVALRGLHDRLKHKIRANLGSVLRRVEQGEATAVLATAAAGEYAVSFARDLGFKHILCTDALAENSGERKRDRVLALLAEQGLHNRRRIFFTDHKADLPLMRESHKVLWFGDERQAEEIKQRAPGVEIIPSLSLPEEEIMKLTEI